MTFFKDLAGTVLFKHARITPHNRLGLAIGRPDVRKHALRGLAALENQLIDR